MAEIDSHKINPQAALGIGATFIAVGAVLVGISNDSTLLWASGLIVLVIGAMLSGAGLAVARDRQK